MGKYTLSGGCEIFLQTANLISHKLVQQMSAMYVTFLGSMSFSFSTLTRGILCIHPSFRIIGLAEPPIVGSSQQQWLNSELLSMFLFHHVCPLCKKEEAQVIYDMVRRIELPVQN